MNSSVHPVMALLLLLVPPAAGQELAPGRGARPVGGPMGRLHYDVGTGRVTKLVRPARSGSPVVAEPQRTGARATVRFFRNTITYGYFTTGTLGAEYVDWASKRTGGTELVTRVTFAYATNIRAPGQASLDLSFYTGTTGFCTLGNEVPGSRVAFRGLPGTTATLPPGFGQAFVVTAFLADPFCLPDGPIGWGYDFLDADPTGGSLTGPLLTDLGTNTGWRDAFDFWARAPASTDTCVGTFFFGGCLFTLPPPVPNTPCASFYLGLSAFTPDATASCAVYNGSGCNPVQLADVSGGPRIGADWVTAVDLGAPPVGLASFLACTAAGTIPGIKLGGIFGGSELLIFTTLIGPVDVSATGFHTIPIPKEPGLDGFSVACQAGKFTGPGAFPLVNALVCTIGS